ncbi:YARHG domain-containing protein [Clostridium sporogenes]|uniref:YARHG domain-containing protein n=1 Tax=Clostridium sporogenes TaxID=1509 RepID=UPI0013D898A3|nr:YARHG domain-containing protein [Clostridium sporogenes]MCW6094423.1 YARHG domain-containing protein [Clostridium sporogenes]NFH31955.1 YARHG domain-containing protein [Clostridium sporogenes]NFL21972.1 YARHG domain-containing protein [Clostridium sporogenes]NFN74749.1 YARHG domain-containing protein [Clostridium sporogenes]NFV24018.1 YARHG domain-containing protein [Clostridium sporogenes]
MSYCEKCGTKLEDRDKFCKKCGTKVIKEHPKEKNLEETTLEKENTSEEEMDKLKDKNNIDESTILINSEDVHNELEKTYKTMVKERNRESFSKEDYDEMENDDFEEDDDEDYGNKNKKILVFTSIFVIVICFITAFLFKDNIMCNHYIKKADKEMSEIEKIRNYNKALGYKYKDEIINEIYETVKNTEDFEEKLSGVYKLKEEDKKKVLNKIFSYKANDSFQKENYEECAKLLEKAKKNGYNIKEFAKYNELLTKLNTEDKKQFEDNSSSQYTYKNSNPTIGESHVNSLGDVYYKNHNEYNNVQGYIVPQSNQRYLTEDELKNYDKYTLDLIRNEIYARYGYAFKEEPFKSYFSNKNWYVKDESFKGADSELNNYELKNIKLLLELSSKK